MLTVVKLGEFTVDVWLINKTFRGFLWRNLYEKFIKASKKLHFYMNLSVH